MSKKWIFQDIKDAQEQVLYRTSSDAPIKEAENNIEAYYARLRETVEPETYVRYELWKCDIDVDMEYIITVTLSIYGDKVSREQVMRMIYRNIEDRHEITDKDREIKKRWYLGTLTFSVTYIKGTDYHTHKTTYQGAFDLLGGRLQNVGVTRDAKAAALRAFEQKCLSDDWEFPFEAGVITITKVDG